ncbi:MAG: dimethylarginine dimethylaminohydrolase family protein [Steroidobacteraceae bacterium]
MRYTRAIVRPPPPTYAQGITSANEGAPELARALTQHQAYCLALEQCGLAVSVLSADADFPDSCFVEDAAVLTPRGAITTRPGAPSRAGEVSSIVAALHAYFSEIASITAPGTVDGGDVCEAEGHFLIGLTQRTNEEGASQLAGLLADIGFPSSVIDLRGSRRLLHLKTGLSYLDDGRMLITSDVPRTAALAPYELVEAPDSERYAANCLCLNDKLVIAEGYPATRAALEACGYEILALGMSEFRKMDGGLSCLSLRF